MFARLSCARGRSHVRQPAVASVAPLAELVDALDSKSSFERSAGSTPAWGTISPLATRPAKTISPISFGLRDTALFAQIASIACIHLQALSQPPLFLHQTRIRPSARARGTCKRVKQFLKLRLSTLVRCLNSFATEKEDVQVASDNAADARCRRGWRASVSIDADAARIDRAPALSGASPASVRRDRVQFQKPRMVPPAGSCRRGIYPCSSIPVVRRQPARDAIA